MKIAAVSLGLVLLIGLSGRQSKNQVLQDGKVRISVDKVLESSDIACIRLDLTFSGKHTVYVTQKSSNKSAACDPDPKTGTADCKIVLLADLLDLPTAPQLKWLAQICARNVTVGGPAIRSIEKGKKLEDILKVAILSGNFSLGAEIELGTLDGEAMKLKVE
jgi:hypothetical protein